MKKKDTEKAAELKKGLRLNIKKAPKVEIPKSVYSRKGKHKTKPGPEG